MWVRRRAEASSLLEARGARRLEAGQSSTLEATSCEQLPNAGSELQNEVRCRIERFVVQGNGPWCTVTVRAG